ncbi:MAG: sigma-70 family RNA polymerase sigma factor [Burkholderiales bacterium]|nr:sigma-70 family RNA polymerase sigma factor [Burkholderiales bacterium]
MDAGGDQTVGSAFATSYEALLQLARRRLAGERAPISAATLAHELFLDMQHRTDLRFANRAQFLAYASRAMRHLLVDMARERLAAKRHSEMLPLTLGAEVADGAANPEQLLVLNEALERLAQLDERLFEVAQLRAVLGLEVQEVAELLGVSEPTVKRDWQRAKAFLHGLLRD